MHVKYKKKVLYAIFFSGEGVAIQVSVKKLYRKIPQKCGIEESSCGHGT